MVRLRFAVLRHANCPRTRNHYDVMLEKFPGSDPNELALMKFETTSELDQTKINLSFRGMSRRHYLQFVGPISQGRGDVKRIDEGDFALSGTNHLNIEFRGKILRGNFFLEKDDKYSPLTNITEATILRKNPNSFDNH